MGRVLVRPVSTGLKDHVLWCVGDVMKSKDPMDLHNVETQDKACAHEDTQEEWVRRGSLAPEQKSNENGDGDDEYYNSSRRRVDQKHVSLPSGLAVGVTSHRADEIDEYAD